MSIITKKELENYKYCELINYCKDLKINRIIYSNLNNSELIDLILNYDDVIDDSDSDSDSSSDSDSDVDNDNSSSIKQDIEDYLKDFDNDVSQEKKFSINDYFKDDSSDEKDDIYY